jgi:hypothetical protein
MQRILNELWRTRLRGRRIPSPISNRSFSLSLPVCHRSSLVTGEGRGGGEGAKPYDGEKSCSSLNHSILSEHHGYFAVIQLSLPECERSLLYVSLTLSSLCVSGRGIAYDS